MRNYHILSLEIYYSIKSSEGFEKKLPCASLHFFQKITLNAGNSVNCNINIVEATIKVLPELQTALIYKLFEIND